jgi:pyrroloquinoline-quinone synthase
VDFWNAMEDVRARRNVLDHPFYRRWSCGELSRDELATYSGQYRHAVVALARATHEAAAMAADEDERTQLAAHAAEEAAHVALWDGFVRTIGGDVEAPPTPESSGCADVWARPGRPLAQTLVALYAIEAGQPAISETKRAGLRAHYGMNGGCATAYFDLHAVRDREHADAARALIERRLAGADGDALLAEAGAVLEANWRLLDGVERLGGTVGA